MLVVEKEHNFETKHSSVLSVYIREIFSEENQSILTWPCGVLLASFIVSNASLFHQKTLIELGAGTGIASITASLVGAKQCFLNEREGEDLILGNLEHNLKRNKVTDKCCIVSIIIFESNE